MVRTRAVVAVVYTGDDGCCDDGEGVYFQGWVYACTHTHIYLYTYIHVKACVRRDGRIVGGQGKRILGKTLA